VTASGLDFMGDFRRGRIPTGVTMQRSANIIDSDVGSSLGTGQRDCSANAKASSGYQYRFSVQHFHFLITLWQVEDFFGDKAID
jgi:hypothetical protein